ncbi:MAG: threonine ammonia-lyase [Candidatus Nanopelagicales bacterium]|nr:threonine ammonia-lyase [Candidatus Nanopelagicales bacterium]
MSEKHPVSLNDIKEAQKRLHGVIRPTNLIKAGWLERQIGNSVLLKPENLQRAGSFKIRGAYNLLAQLSAEDRKKGVVAASAGNHAQGVALAAQLLGIKSTVFMPVSASIPKVVATKGYGAEVKFAGDVIDEAIISARQYCEASGSVFIPPFDHKHIVAGQGTVGLEIFEQMPEVKTVLVCTGGGGLLSGSALAIKEQNPKVKVIGVQAANAAAYPQSLKEGKPVALKVMNTIADGIAVGKPGDIPFGIIQDYVDEIITVSESNLSIAILQTLERGKLLVEPGGAAAVAAFIANPEAFEGPVAVVLSGGNIDPLLLERIMQTGLATAGRYLTVRIRIKDKPGTLAQLLTEIGGLGANILDIFHLRTDPMLALDEVAVNITMETRGVEHEDDVLNRIKALGHDAEVQ